MPRDFRELLQEVRKVAIKSGEFGAADSDQGHIVACNFERV
jgi:hypothetical protein